MPLIDLYAIHEDKARAGLLSIHPSRWLYAGRNIGRVFEIFSDDYQVVEVGGQRADHFKQLAGMRLHGKSRQKHGYYLATQAIADRYFKYVPKGGTLECAVRDLLALEETNAQVEAHTPVGFIDLLCSTSVVEVKHLSKWKQALGQVLAYSTYYPKHSKILHLYSSGIGSRDIEEQMFVCRNLNVDLRHQAILSSAHGPASRVERPVKWLSLKKCQATS
ncbi:hypothetical protein DZC30_15805 [Comamonas testosteroni]|uniref:Uncharacterized protein n=1 Tax=Comamonas testosteroni TaxID=285 RepID=A0A373FIR3_COMTE|nr:hypothetical protein [Comamonas testosteroni]RGE43279.1 hypothetical protein DZC30_15805 [Comamonas testosteroni]